MKNCSFIKMNKKIEELLLSNGYEGIKYLSNYSYDDALVGVTADGRTVYDFNKMIEWLMREEDCTYEEAVEWVEYNTIRAIPYMGDDGPIVFYPLEDY